MVYSTKKSVLINALCYPILGENGSRHVDRIDLNQNKATIRFSSRNHGLTMNLQCSGTTSPVRFKGIDFSTDDLYQMHFELVRPEDQPFTHLKPETPQAYTLQFRTSTPLEKVIYNVSEQVLKEREKRGRDRILDNIPESFETRLRYDTTTGSWNALPPEILDHVRKFTFKVADVGVEFERHHEGRIRLTPSLLPYGNNERYELLVERLQQAGLIERSRKDRGAEKYDTITLIEPNPAKVMRQLEDALRTFDIPNLTSYGRKAEIEIDGNIPITTIARIPTHLSMQSANLASDLFTIGSYQEGGGWGSPQIPSITFNGTLETAAKIETLLPYLKDLQIQALDPGHSNKPLPIFKTTDREPEKR